MRKDAAHSSRKAAGRRGFKHLKIREQLRREIQEGKLAPGTRLPPDSELHKRFKVNRLTAIRALDELAREGLIVRRRGDGTYVADRRARPLIPGRVLTIGIAVPLALRPEGLFEDHFGQMLLGALEALGAAEASPDLSRAQSRDGSRGTWTAVERGVRAEVLGPAWTAQTRAPELRHTQDARMDGLLALNIIEAPWIEAQLARNVPTVLTDFPNDRFALQTDHACFEPRQGYGAAVRHFLERGARRIHFVGAMHHAPAPSADLPAAEALAWRLKTRRPDPDTLTRLSAFRSAMDLAGQPVPAEAVHLPQYSREETALAERLAGGPEALRPDAVICHGIEQAETMVRVFASHGLRLLGTGAAPAYYRGPLSPIRADSRELGRVAGETLLWRLLRPERAAVSVGVPMVFDTGAQTP